MFIPRKSSILFIYPIIIIMLSVLSSCGRSDTGSMQEAKGTAVKDPELLSKLVTMAKSKDPAVKHDAIKNLMFMNDHPKAIDALSLILLNDPNENNRKNAAYALGHYDDPCNPRAISPLAKAMASDKSKDVRDAARYVLAYSKNSKAIAPLASDLKKRTRARILSS